MKPQKYPVPALILLAVAAGLLWLASRLNWVRVTSADGLGQQQTASLDGGTWVSVLTPLALVLLASIAAVFALRGWARRLLGVVLAVAGGAVAVPGFALLTSGAPESRVRQLADLPGRADVLGIDTFWFAAVVCLAGACAEFAGGVLLARRGGGQAGLSTRYDSPGARRDRVAESEPDSTADRLSERELWDALDSGHDPTGAEPANRPDNSDRGDTRR